MSLRDLAAQGGLTCLVAVAMTLTGPLAAEAFAQTDATAAYTGSSKDPKPGDAGIMDDLHHAVCWVNCSASANGAGWVLDVKQRLVLTSRRVIHGAKHVLVYFPEKRLGRWETDEAHYLKSAKAYSATIIASDYWHDTALLQLEGLPSTAKALKFAPGSAAKGDRLHQLSAKTPGVTSLWSQNSGLVRGSGLGPFYNPWKPLVLVASMFATRASRGEPLVDDRGHVVGTVDGATTSEHDGKPLATGGTAVRALDVRQVKHWLKPVLPLVDPKTAADYYERGKRHVDENRYKQAIDDLNTAISRDGTQAKAYSQRGWARSNSKDYRTALADFDKSLLMDSKDDNALYGRGIVHYALRKTADALRDLNAAIALNSKVWQYHYWRGIVQYESRKYRDALNDFTQAASMPGAEAIVFQYKGSSAVLLKEYRTGAGAYNQANRLNPTVAANHNREGVCYYNLKQFDKAAQKFRDAIRINSTYSLYHENLGNTYHELGKYADAIDAYTFAIRNSSYAASTLYLSRGFSRMARKDYTLAVQDFTTAISKNAKYAAAYYQRARAHVALGKTDLASKDLEMAKSLDKARYGSVTLAGLGTAAPVKPAGTTTTASTGAGASKLAGRWHFRQKFNGNDTEIDLTFQGNGTYTSRITIFDDNGRGTPALESGTYAAKEGKLTLTPKTGKAVVRSYGFELKQMWIFFEESRVTIHFDRK